MITKDFKRADELPRKMTPVNVDLGILENPPTTRKERINLMMATILLGHRKNKYYPLLRLIRFFSMIFSLTEKKIIEYMKLLENSGHIKIGHGMYVLPTEKGLTCDSESDSIT